MKKGKGLVCRILATAACGGVGITTTGLAESFTNSSILSAAVDNSGTNLVITWSMSTTQGWVTLFSATEPDQLGTNAQPVDLAHVPPSMQGQFTVPINPAAPAQFYRLLIEQWPSRGKALVFVNGPVDFDAMIATYGSITNSDGTGTNMTPMIFKQPVEVWIDNLGNYDTNGVLVGSNQGALAGRYATSSVYPLNDPQDGFPPIPSLNSPGNDFRVNYLGDASVNERHDIIWSSQVQFYHDVNDYRNRFLNDSFIDSLNLPQTLAANLKSHQFRPDLSMGGGEIHAMPTLRVAESVLEDGQRIFPVGNVEQIPLRTRGPYLNEAILPPLSLVYGGDNAVGDYAGIVQFWALGTNGGFPYETSFPSQWTYNILAALNNGLSAWTAYRYSGNTEPDQQFWYGVRIWAGAPCGGTGVPCAKGKNLRNVMMADVPSNTSADGVFPFSIPYGFTSINGQAGADLAGMFLGAVFYDIANEAGLGLYKADQLAWKMVSLITNNAQFGFADFGATVQQAARQLWPDPRPGRAGLSLYEEDLVDVLTSRGIPINGVTDFKTNLPPAIWVSSPLLERTSGNQRGFGTDHPMPQPNVNSYGLFSGNLNGYTLTNSGVQYVAYQFYKHSKIGPADIIGLTDGTFNPANPFNPTNGIWNRDGTYFLSLPDRDAGNLVVLAPGPTIRWEWVGARATNEASGFYAEDVRPFGFMVTRATPNGFSFTASALSSNATFKTYQLSVVDPSTNTLGAASYAWTFTDYGGNTNTLSGSTVQYAAYIDEPFTISIARTRASQTDTLLLRERGNDLDRNGGSAFIKNLVP